MAGGAVGGAAGGAAHRSPLEGEELRVAITARVSAGDECPRIGGAERLDLDDSHVAEPAQADPGVIVLLHAERRVERGRGRREELTLGIDLPLEHAGEAADGDELL